MTELEQFNLIWASGLRPWYVLRCMAGKGIFIILVCVTMDELRLQLGWHNATCKA